MEQVLDWLNENERRAYPFLTDVSKAVPLGALPVLPDNFLVDLQLTTTTMLWSSAVSLSRIKRTSTYLLLEFSTPTVLIASFQLPDPNNLTYPYYVRNSDGNLAVFGTGASALYSACNNSTDLTVTIPVEPATCIQFAGAWLGVSSISTSPEKVGYNGSNALNSARVALPLVDVPAGSTSRMVGDVQFLEGYNFRVKVTNSLIDLQAGTGNGLKMDCTTSFLPPVCLDCDEIVSYINGVPPDDEGNFRLLQGSNISITEGTSLPTFNDQFPEPANQHSLFVGLTFQATDLCAPINITPSV
jgi:hypothetical protein